LAATIGLSFALGALFDSALSWRLREFDLAPRAAAVDAENGRPAIRHAPTMWRDDVQAPPSETTASSDVRSASPPVATAGELGHSAAVEILRERDLKVPIEDVGEDELRDTFLDSRNGRMHEALDIMAPRHTPVRAVEDGTIAKLFNSRGGGGIAIYQFDPTNTFCYYYAHLERYAPGLREGQRIERGQTIGYVGSTGNASPDAPHLHFAIFRLSAERKWWQGEPVNPYSVFH
jgi:murein DD-endopeptidase MepM/ murein hydrolase activator NlpD